MEGRVKALQKQPASQQVKREGESDEELAELITNISVLMDDPNKNRIAPMVLNAAITSKGLWNRPKCLEEVATLRTLRDKLVTIIGFRKYPQLQESVLTVGESHKIIFFHPRFDTFGEFEIFSPMFVLFWGFSLV